MSERVTRTSRRQSAPEQGFTLVEVMVGVVVVGIIAAIAVPNLRSYRESHRIWSQTEQMAAICRAAQSRARSEDHQILIEYQADQGQYLVIDDENNNGQADAGEIVTTHPMADGLAIASTTFTNDRLVFDNRGRVATGGSVVVAGHESDDGHKRLDIAAGTGHISIMACTAMGDSAR